MIPGIAQDYSKLRSAVGGVFVLMLIALMCMESKIRTRVSFGQAVPETLSRSGKTLPLTGLPGTSPFTLPS
jgi:hypothetical protein